MSKKKILKAMLLVLSAILMGVRTAANKDSMPEIDDLME